MYRENLVQSSHPPDITGGLLTGFVAWVQIPSCPKPCAPIATRAA